MNYDDFPILNDEAYDFLKDKFNEAGEFNRNVNVNKLFAGVVSCRSQILGAKEDENKEIKIALKFVENELNKIEQNLEENFNIYAEKKQVKTLNVFSLLKDLVAATRLVSEWCRMEKKEYLKNLAHITLNSLLNCGEEIVSAINKCNIKIFRFM